MKHLFAFLLVCGNILFAQYRFQYQVSFKIDSLNRDFLQTEIFNLDFYENKSLFYPEVFVKRDSVVANGGSINRSNLPEPKLDYIVSFNIEDDKKDYVFDLVGIQKNIEKPMQLEFLSKLGIKSVKTDYEKFKKVKKRFLDNPSAFFQQMPGLSELPAEELKKINDGFVQREKKQNNKIELSF